MCLFKFFVGFVAVSSAAGSIIRHTEITSMCEESEFRCSNGTCITADLVCNNLQDCPDGADEASCYTELESYEITMKAPLRSKRQTKCRKSEFQCLDGSCIPSHQRCDGRYHCEDQSDESHALCRKTKCPPHAFTCMYGACIDGDQLCNGVDDCVDGSDELHPKCRKEAKNYGKYFTCFDGTKISSTNLCDGKAHCPDRSDEVLQSCAGVKCPSYGFQCAYGACVDQDADCNGKVECADGSDENEQLCANQEVTGPNSISSRFDKPRTNQRKCFVPPNPDHGKFELTASDALNNFLLTVNCDPDYTVVGNNKIFCNNGVWSQNVSRHHCVRYCTLKKHPSVFYKCLESGQWEGERDCNHIEPEGTMVRATCNFHYNSSNNRQTMICQGGEWSRNITCEPECGTIPPQIEQLSIGGRSAFRGEVSWQAAVYEIDQRSYNYELICGGSIINNDFIISAAHCFWNETAGGTKNAQSIAIAVGKHYRDWNNKSDIHEQKFDVDKIFIPELYQHISNGYARDIALLKLNTSIVYTNFVRPICLDFNIVLPLKQSQPYDIGRVAGWGYMSPEGHLPRVLRLVHLPYHLLETCADLTDISFRSHLGTDKICAGYNNGTATLCKGDSGGGLAFPVEKERITRYYLKGIVSNGPHSENNTLCNPRAVILFTDIYYFKPFIRNVLNKYHYIV
ncbi:modular serine protease-like [Spodoptera frugiperda]|uniref:Modular serine protease-like n=1 Tax=Spodoptera frugiperda TaxID=7108 RepID=A0A9R0E657_SPOFR|nr:modular serine protease-like [Spodoptera frugiperda]